MLLEISPHLRLPPSTRHLISAVNRELSPNDMMYDGNDHYLFCGASALNVIFSALSLADVSEPVSILDFGAGAGRVTRWLRAAFPSAAIDACDIRESDMEFCRTNFAARTWVSSVDVDSLRPLDAYDLLWVGSVVTHLTSRQTIGLLDKMISWVTVKGLIVMSFHGRLALQRQNNREFRYIDDAGWKAITAGYENTGFGYSDYEGQSGYGVSLTKLSWITALIEHRSDWRMVTLSESAWDGHHDVLVLQRVV